MLIRRFSVGRLDNFVLDDPLLLNNFTMNVNNLQGLPLVHF